MTRVTKTLTLFVQTKDMNIFYRELFIKDKESAAHKYLNKHKIYFLLPKINGILSKEGFKLTN